ncbi:ATP-binding cassette domain-containing protein [Qipengyuania sp. JC766]|uniref:ATP-binding cassette domain-containing protein n=1 Tax=Qipengyuania sp. JC766 TaxID=3232139 RepID=UPI0034587FEB
MSFDIAFSKTRGDCSIAPAIVSDAPLIALVGPSGAGKTTMLDCVAGLLAPDAGHIRVEGSTLFDAGARIALTPDRRRIGYVFQDDRLFPHMSVARNLDYGARLAKGRPSPLPRAEIIAMLGIEALRDRRPGTLSGGEKRRVSIGRALLSAPSLLLLDEPLVSLDAERAEIILSALETIRERLSLPTLLVSHDEAQIARLGAPVFRIDGPA